ncbi:MAG TPA: hypothetical protein VFC63_06010 [Blastocatellia bacterium]|nr:hypothetical protein [Blastocatellia bacterium]
MSKKDITPCSLVYSQEPVEITVEIRADQALALELIQNAEEQKSGVPYDQSALVRQALDMLINSRLIAIRLQSNTATKQLLATEDAEDTEKNI